MVSSRIAKVCGDLNPKSEIAAVEGPLNPTYIRIFPLDIYTPLAYSIIIMEIIETPIFTKHVNDLLNDDEYRILQFDLINRPDAGPVIPGTGGLRKLRWACKGHGKRGGVRLIYYWFTNDDQILMLLIYPKNVQDDLTDDQKKMLVKLVKQELDYRK
jgi:hypothetical protein